MQNKICKKGQKQLALDDLSFKPNYSVMISVLVPQSSSITCNLHFWIQKLI